MTKIIEIIYDTLDFKKNIKFEYVKKDGVYVSYKDGIAEISDKSISCFTRGLALMIKEIRAGKTEFVIEENENFEIRGLQLDVSRNGVMNITSVKKYLNYMACMGLNSFILYMEDVFKLDGHPFFGYMRGAYTHEELKEIDDYAHNLGIKVIPHIQTMGHMAQYFKWSASSKIRNDSQTFLCGEEKTYEFIEKMISTMRNCFRSKELHIGCDEAPSIASSKYLKKNGQRNPVDVMNEHIAKVVEICNKYDFKPIMYSDLYFSMNSALGLHYHPDTEFPENFGDQIPDVDLVYWDYGRTEEERYSKLIKMHKTFGKKIIFAGGIWGWLDILPRYTYTLNSFPHALQACLKNNVTDVYGTIWGDDGCECNKMYELFMAPIVSEYCFKGIEASLDDVYEMISFIFGIKPEFFEAVSESAMPYNETESYGLDDTFYGKGLFYSDVFFNMTFDIDFYRDAKFRYKKSLKVIKNTFTDHKWKDYEDFAVRLYDILYVKADMSSKVREAYEKGNKEYLEKMVYVILPKLKKKYVDLLKLWQKMWFNTFKAFGWEIINGRLAFVIARLDYALERIKDYLNGKIEYIEELEEPILFSENIPSRRYKNIITSTIDI